MYNIIRGLDSGAISFCVVSVSWSLPEKGRVLFNFIIVGLKPIDICCLNYVFVKYIQKKGTRAAITFLSVFFLLIFVTLVAPYDGWGVIRTVSVGLVPERASQVSSQLVEAAAATAAAASDACLRH